MVVRMPWLVIDMESSWQLTWHKISHKIELSPDVVGRPLVDRLKFFLLNFFSSARVFVRVLVGIYRIDNLHRESLFQFRTHLDQLKKANDGRFGWKEARFGNFAGVAIVDDEWDGKRLNGWDNERRQGLVS